MVLFHTHLLIGVIFYLLTYNYIPGNVFVNFMFCLLGSILPDIDEPNSKVNKAFGIIGYIVSKLSIHRGFFHSIFFMGILFWGLSRYNLGWGLSISLGYLAHLFGDSITRRGIYVFYPIKTFKFKGPLRVGSFFEKVLAFVLYGSIAYIVLH